MNRADKLYPTMQDDGTQVLVGQETVKGSKGATGSVLPRQMPSSVVSRLRDYGVPAEEVDQIFQDLMQEWNLNVDSQEQDRSQPPDHRYRRP